MKIMCLPVYFWKKNYRNWITFSLIYNILQDSGSNSYAIAQLFFSYLNISELSTVASANNDVEWIRADNSDLDHHSSFEQHQLVSRQQLRCLRRRNIEKTAKRNFITHFIISRCRVVVPVCPGRR